MKTIKYLKLLSNTTVCRTAKLYKIVIFILLTRHIWVVKKPKANLLSSEVEAIEQIKNLFKII